MTHSHVRGLCFLACAVSVAAVRYGDYSVAHMPQYADQHEGSDVARHDEYSDTSLDAPAGLDYKYEEESHGKSDNLPVNDIIDGRIWIKPDKKKLKSSMLHSDFSRDLDKYTLDETDPELKSDNKVIMRTSEFRKRKFAKQNQPRRHLKHDIVDQGDDIDNTENNSEYVHKQNDGHDLVEISDFGYMSPTQKKPRRKPRDRALHPPQWRESNNNAKLEQDDVDGLHFEIKNARRIDGIINREDMDRLNKNKYDYDEYYDMKRVQHMKSRLPALLRQPTVTVRKREAKSTSYSAHWLNRRADTPATQTVSEPVPTSTLNNITTSTVTTTTTSDTKFTPDLSLGEKSRLSILKKAQRKESLRNISLSTKPPVLMQVTRKMQTLVMVEPRPPEPAMRAREVLDDSPERLQRARRLMRHKLVAAAQSIHQLTDNWDEMICDYIDVSLLDTDAAYYIATATNAYVTLLLCFVSSFLFS